MEESGEGSRLGTSATFPCTPRTNGKAERFVQTSLREWAYAKRAPAMGIYRGFIRGIRLIMAEPEGELLNSLFEELADCETQLKHLDQRVFERPRGVSL